MRSFLYTYIDSRTHAKMSIWDCSENTANLISECLQQRFGNNINTAFPLSLWLQFSLFVNNVRTSRAYLIPVQKRTVSRIGFLIIRAKIYLKNKKHDLTIIY